MVHSSAALFPVIIALLGACFGSFGSVLIYRLRFDEPLGLWARTRHHKTNKLASLDRLLPILSWIKPVNKKHNTKNIPVVYLWLEVLFVLVFGLFAYKYLALQYWFEHDWTIFLEFGLLFFALILFFYDALYLLVDRRVSFPAIGLALIWAIAQPEWINYLIGGAVGFSFYWIQCVISREKWVGAGDQEIGLFMGLVLGWTFLLYGLFLAYVIGCLYALIIKIAGQKIGLGSALPMGAFLIPAMLVMMYDGAWIEQQYWDLFTFPLLF